LRKIRSENADCPLRTNNSAQLAAQKTSSETIEVLCACDKWRSLGPAAKWPEKTGTDDLHGCSPQLAPSRDPKSSLTAVWAKTRVLDSPGHRKQGFSSQPWLLALEFVALRPVSLALRLVPCPVLSPIHPTAVTWAVNGHAKFGVKRCSVEPCVGGGNRPQGSFVCYSAR